MRNPLITGLSILLWIGLLSSIAEAQTGIILPTLNQTKPATTDPSFTSPEPTTVSSWPQPTTDLPLLDSTKTRRALVAVNRTSALIRSQINDFYQYRYDGTSFYISDGRGDMYDNGNKVYFSRGMLNQSAEYNETYTFPDFTFSSLAVHPFTALMWIDSNDIYLDYTIQLISNLGADGSGSHDISSGTLYGRNFELKYKVFQVYGANDPSVVEVFFLIRSHLWGSSTAWIVLNVESVSRNHVNNRAVVSNNGSSVRNVFFGYTLLSKDPDVFMTDTEIRNALLVMGNAIVHSENDSGIVLPPFTTAVPIYEFQEARRSLFGINKTAAMIRAQVADFYQYEYDRGSFDISDGGEDMYDGGNNVYFSRGSHNQSAEYNETYLFPDFTFSSLAIHPFIALFWINSGHTYTEYSIEVNSNLGADGSGSIALTSGTINRVGFQVTYEVVQAYGASDPTVVEVYFVVSKPQWGSSSVDLDLERGSFTTARFLNRASVRNNGSAVENVIFGYTLLSKISEQITNDSEIINVLEKIGEAISNSARNFSIILPPLMQFTTPNPTTYPTTTYPDSTTYPTHDPFTTNAATTTPSTAEEFKQSRRGLVGVKRTSALILSQINNFYKYNYDGDSFEIDDGGNDMYDGGNNVVFSRGMLNQSAEYNETYTYPDFTFSSLAIHPFTALMWIDSGATFPKYAIQLNSNIGADGSGVIDQFFGTVYGANFQLKYRVFQVHGAFDPTVVEVFFLIQSSLWGSSSAVINLEVESFDRNRVINKVTVTNNGSNVENVFFGYTLLSKSPDGITNETEIRNVLYTMGTAIVQAADDSSIILPPLTASTTQPPNAEFQEARRSLVGIWRASSSVRSWIADFFSYAYDGDSFQISDGGSDMYDGGNKVYFSRGFYNQSAEYNQTYVFPDFTFSSLAIHPFISLMWIGSGNTHSKYTIEVISDLGADGSGFIEHTSGTIIGVGFQVKYEVYQAYQTNDPTIAEVYFVVSKPDWRSSSVDLDLEPGSYSTQKFLNRASVTNSGSAVENVIFGYTLLSKSSENITSVTEIRNVLTTIGQAISGAAKDFSIMLPPLMQPTTPDPSTYPSTSFPTHDPFTTNAFTTPSTPFDGSVVGQLLQHLHYAESQITSGLGSFYKYEYDGYSGSNHIADGGNDMYDTGNRVSFNNMGQAEYNQSIQYYGLQAGILAGHPFHAVMWVGEFYYRQNASIRVWGGTGADGNGVVSTLSGSISDGNYFMEYRVFQISQAFLDPTICEVYYDVYNYVNWDSTGGGSVNTNFSRTTDPTDNTFTVLYSPRRHFVGYTLLSKRSGSFVRTDVEDVLRRVLEVYTTVSVPPHSNATTPRPTFTPPSPTPTFTPPTPTPTGPGPVGDVDFLPSCTLRQAIRKVWACESSFTAHAPYNDPGQCRSNVNAVIQCAANQLKNCAKGSGPNIFHRYYLPFDEQYVIHVLRHLASSGSSCHGYDLISNFCNKGSLPYFHPGGPMPFGMNSTTGPSPFFICSHSALYGIMNNLTELYYSYVGARTKQEICTAFRTFRDGFVSTVRYNCNLGALQYYLDHIHPQLYHYVAQASQVAVDSIAVLEISACPKTAVNNTKNRLGTEWLKNYVKWRSGFLPKWQSSFNRWVETLDGVYQTIPEIPPCLDLTLLQCRDPSQYVCHSDFYTCPLCRCMDDRYKGLSQAMLEPWKKDFNNWQIFLELWSEAFDSWEMNENL